MNISETRTSRVSPCLNIQGRVLFALIMREIHTVHGNTRLGYLWSIIQTGSNIAVFWIFRTIFGAHAPHGMGMITFLLCGFIPCLMFMRIVSRCMTAVSANRTLLTFPQITELDLMVARTVVDWGTQIICAIIFIFIAIAIGQKVILRDPMCLFASLVCTPVLGLGAGLIFASLARLWPTWSRIVPLFMRFTFFASGAFFHISSLPSRYAEPLLLNPLAQIIEWQRYGFSSSSASPLYSVPYILSWCLATLCVGLLLERHVRGRGLK